MRFIILSLLFIAFTAAAADIYRWVDEDGSVVFGDDPPEGVNAERIHVREPMTTPALRDAREILERGGDVTGEDNTAPYEQLAIASPGDNEPVRANAGNFSVQVDIRPDLQTDRGHRLRLVMDGAGIQTGDRTTFDLTNVDRGTHRILVQVLDREDQVIQESGTVEFHLLRHHIN
jgi:hypothetical protein